MKNIFFSIDEINFCIRPINLVDINNSYYHLLSQLSYIDSSTLSNGLSENLHKHLDKNHHIFVIEDTTTKQVIGTGTLLIENKIIHNYGNVGHIEDIIISSEYRGKNLGKYLVEFLTDFSKIENQCYKCILNCNQENIGFYEKCNYQFTQYQMSKYF
tara:strand:+ start:2293 stop:2763 length:471 start_codon:yes stop_codon:yes gene_type:complete